MSHAQYLLIDHLLNTLIIKDSNKMEVRQKPLTTHYIILSGTKISKFKNNQKPYFWVFFRTKHRKVSHFGKGKVKKMLF
jgi:hypothetical protein